MGRKNPKFMPSFTFSKPNLWALLGSLLGQFWVLITNLSTVVYSDLSLRAIKTISLKKKRVVTVTGILVFIHMSSLLLNLLKLHVFARLSKKHDHARPRRNLNTDPLPHCQWADVFHACMSACDLAEEFPFSPSSKEVIPCSRRTKGSESNSGHTKTPTHFSKEESAN